jgi:hypothetical protein
MMTPDDRYPDARELLRDLREAARGRPATFGRIDVVAGQAYTVHHGLNAAGSLSVVSDLWADVTLDEVHQSKHQLTSHEWRPVSTASACPPAGICNQGPRNRY